MTIEFRDISEHGLRFVTPDHPRFRALAEQICNSAFMPPPELVNDNAAVLVNDSGQAIIAFAYIWEFRAASGRPPPE